MEKLSTTFTTGKAPDYIPLSNVKYSYPMPMMFNYYQNETDIGYIQLDKGQAYLFEPGAGWKQIGRFADKQGNKYDFNFTYNVSARKVDFKRPGNLQNNAIYSFELVNVPASAKGAIDKNVVTKVESKGVKEGNETTIEMNTKDAEGTIDILQEKSMFEIYFRTSKYNTLSAKIDGLGMGDGSQWPLRPLVHLIYKSIQSGERFDKYEVEGENNISPIILLTNNLDNKTWYMPKIYPYIYENYPLADEIKISDREVEPVGIPPIHTINISLLKGYENLTDENIQTGIFDAEIGYAAFHSYLVHYCEIDYSDLATKACAKFWNSTIMDSKIKHLIETCFPPVDKGDYNFKVNYILPGINKITSTKLLTIKIDY